jgi:hypothetical protein
VADKSPAETVPDGAIQQGKVMVKEIPALFVKTIMAISGRWLSQERQVCSLHNMLRHMKAGTGNHKEITGNGCSACFPICKTQNSPDPLICCACTIMG